MITKPIIRLLLAACVLTVGITACSRPWHPRQFLAFTHDACLNWNADGFAISGLNFEKSRIESAGGIVGVRHRLPFAGQSSIEVDAFQGAGRPLRFSSTLYASNGKALLFASLDADCRLQLLRRINYDSRGRALAIDSLDAGLSPFGETEWLNPPLEFIERESGRSTKTSALDTDRPVRIGMVDSGVNYRIPEINRRLARRPDGKLVGYDFWDQDDLPYDAHPTRSEFFVQRHGTRTASLLLAEAPAIELVPYRYPRNDMTRMTALVEHAARHQVTILGMPLGGDRREEWQAFAQAARAHPDMLFIVSAGNNGRDIDEAPIYPAALDLNNMLVVTSADDFVRPASRTNWGRVSVDYLIPAENIETLDYSGAKVTASGSSYAVARLTALAANLKSQNRNWSAADLIAELRRRHGGQTGDSALDWVAGGYIADPLAHGRLQITPYAELFIDPAPGTSLGLALDILVLDPGWTQARIEGAVRQAYTILAQCGIGPGKISLHSVRGGDYLRDLSTGRARTLLEAVAGDKLVVLFARDTRMLEAFSGEAFGLGNTSTRPWLANSVWLMQDIRDEGIALAHELFHVIANSGEHVEGSSNLMQSNTRVADLALLPRQCRRAQVMGKTNRLLTDLRF